MMSNIYNVAIIGAGLMGHGIGLTLARAGHSVIIYDPMEDARNSVHARIANSMDLMGLDPNETSNAIAKITTRDTIASSVRRADIVFEAAPEKLELKQSIFAEVETHAPKTCILASNTSVMPITKIMSQLRHKSRALGTHWWNPPHMIPLVEVINTEWTDQRIAEQMMVLLKDIGKTPVLVKKDVPGFIGNRLQHALWREAISLVENGICDAQAVDTVVKSSFGRRLSVLGPLENADLVGTDLTLDIHNNVLFDLESEPKPSLYLEALVEEGKLGMKSGEGFQSWSEAEAAEVRERVASHLKKLDGILTD